MKDYEISLKIGGFLHSKCGKLDKKFVHNPRLLSDNVIRSIVVVDCGQYFRVIHSLRLQYSPIFKCPKEHFFFHNLS